MGANLPTIEVCSREFVGVSESDSVLETTQLLHRERSGSAIVLRGDEPVGIVTEYDILGHIAAEGDPASTAVEAIMSKPVISVTAETPLDAAADTMATEDIRQLPVTNGSDQVVGLLTERDIIAADPSVGDGPVTAELRLQATEEPVQMNAEDAALTISERGVCDQCGKYSDRLESTETGALVCAECRSVE